MQSVHSDDQRKYILFHAAGATEETFFAADSRDNCSQPFIALRNRCAEMGYTLDITRDQPLDQCAWIVFWDVPSLGPRGVVETAVQSLKRVLRPREFRNIFREAITSWKRPGLALLVAEPPSIVRANARTESHKDMDIVLTWNESWLARGGKYVRTVLPVTSEFPNVKQFEFESKKLLVDISANKFSSHAAELYSARREAIRYFEQRFPDDFDLYGVGWDGLGKQSFGLTSTNDRHHYVSYRGRVSHKWDVLPRYRFAICYENAAIDDYVSQRIFDVLRCGCVPIYWGAPDIGRHVDAGAFVDRRKFGSNEELADYLRHVTEDEYEQMRDAGQRYLKSDRFRPYLAESWGEALLTALGLLPVSRSVPSAHNSQTRQTTQ
jgi:hypothetical protein